MRLQRSILGVIAGTSLFVAASPPARGAEDTINKGNRQSDQSSKQSAGNAMSHTSTSRGAGGQERTASGRITSVDQKEVTFANGEQVRLTDKTKFFRAGQTVSRKDVKIGDEARAAYEPRDSLAYATQVEIEKGSMPGKHHSASKDDGAME